MKKILLWTGIKNKEASNKYNYGDFEWMNYSRLTWEYYCNKYGYVFIPFENPIESDTLKVKINWQRWLYLDQIIPLDYDAVLSTDASIMIKWDAPDLIELYKDKFSALKANENLKWTYQSSIGYQDLFLDVNFNLNNYIASGFILFFKQHHYFWNIVKNFYYENKDEIIRREDVIVKRGRDQPVINYLLTKYNIPVNFLPIKYGVNHLYRHEVLNNSWQMSQHFSDEKYKLPHFIRFFDVWIFSGFSDRGETRTKLMKQTWDIIKDNYK